MKAAIDTKAFADRQIEEMSDNAIDATGIIMSLANRMKPHEHEVLCQLHRDVRFLIEQVK